jgi:hypothetical protein
MIKMIIRKDMAIETKNEIERKRVQASCCCFAREN